jgi:hypothetical protein
MVEPACPNLARRGMALRCGTQDGHSVRLNRVLHRSWVSRHFVVDMV